MSRFEERPIEDDPIDTGTQEHPSFLSEERSSIAPHKRKLLSTTVFLAFFLLLAAFLTYLLLPANAPENPFAYDPVTLEPKPPEGFLKKISHFVLSKDVALAGERDDRINILLLGIGGEGHEGPYLSDTIMIASVKPSTKQIAMISIPRDLLVEIPDKGPQKINHANAFGEAKKANWGGALATQVVEDTFAIDISYYLRVDFRAFEDIINALGGIKVNVDRSFTDPLYPAPNFAYQTVAFSRGVQTMDGVTALQYARSRHGSNGEGSDFARSRRQQKALFAVKEKILSAATLINPIRIKGILDALDTHITTNMSFGEMMEFLQLGREFSTDEITTLVLDTAEQGYLEPGVGPEGAFVLAPKDGNFDAIQDAIKHIFEEKTAQADGTPEQGKPMIAETTAHATGRVEIQNGTWRAGLAARMKKRLTDEDFSVGVIGNTAARPQAKSAIYIVDSSAPKNLVEAFQKELHVPIENNIPPDIVPASTTNILIILGEDLREE